MSDRSIVVGDDVHWGPVRVPTYQSHILISAYFTEATFLAKSSSQGNTTCTSRKMFSAIQIQIQTRLLTPTKNEEKKFGQNILIWILRNIHLIVRNICLYKLSSVVAESL